MRALGRDSVQESKVTFDAWSCHVMWQSFLLQLYSLVYGCYTPVALYLPYWAVSRASYNTAHCSLILPKWTAGLRGKTHVYYTIRYCFYGIVQLCLWYLQIYKWKSSGKFVGGGHELVFFMYMEENIKLFSQLYCLLCVSLVD